MEKSMLQRPCLKILPTLILLLLTGCGGGGSDAPASASTTSGTPATSSGSTPPASGTSNTVQLATATVLADGTSVGAAQWPAGSSASGGQGQAIDGLACAVPSNSYTYAHLSVFQDGKQITVPTNIGVVGPTLAAQTGCVYPLHTDDASGKIRIDASATAPLTLGKFFSVWGQTLSATNVAGLSAQSVTAYINDGGTLTKYTGDLAAIPLQPHREITLLLGSVPSQIPTYQWSDPPPLATTPTVLSETTLGTTTWADGNTATGGHGETIDGVQCANMADNYHVHAHLTIVKDGQMLAVPAQIGRITGCDYEIHTHDASGELHVESTAVKRFTLGQLFKIWGQPLSATGVAGLSGQPVKFYINDNGDVREYVGDPAQIELASRRAITIQIGSTPATLATYTWDTAQ
jgi:hypothetical protein